MTNDTIGRLIKYTVLNPALTLPLILLGRYTTRGNILAAEHGTFFKHLKTIVGLGLLRSVSAWLDDAVTNNWSNDTYVWSQEVVVVTGGADGIGKIVVHLLAERGIKVAVLDVQELTYEGVYILHQDQSGVLQLTNLSTPLRPLLQLRSLLALLHRFRRLANPLHARQPHRAHQQRRCRARPHNPRQH